MDIFKFNIDRKKYFIVTYRLGATTNLKEAAWQLAIGQSVGNPNVRNRWETDELFDNHSCIILSNKNISLAMDPWTEGSVFNNSWNLLVNTPNNLVENLKKSNYVWFSHEHPDHFNPPNLKIFNHKTNFLFQKTKDKRVVNFLSKISNNLKELSFKEEFFLDESFSIQIIPFQYSIKNGLFVLKLPYHLILRHFDIF